MEPSSKLLEAVAVTLELTGTALSEVAVRVFAEDLSRYPDAQVLPALTRCRRECKGRLTIADVLSRLEDGRPGVEEAWAMLPKDEQTTAVWTVEMSQASAVVHDLLDRGDEVAARMAFKEAYSKACQLARDRGEPVSWSASLGWDKGGRESVLKAAVAAGRLSREQISIYLPPEEAQPLLVSDAVQGRVKALADRLCK